jgi:hypothetical protein
VLVVTSRRPVPVLVVLAGFVGLVCGWRTPDADQARFRAAAELMLGPGFFDVFADPWIQVGPLFLLPLGALSLALGALGLPDAGVTGAVAGAEAAFLVWLVLLVVRRASREHAPLLAQWVVGGVVVLGGLLAEVMLSDHPEELAVGLLLALAGLSATRGQAVAAGLLVAAATGLKQWGPLGGGVLLRTGSVGAVLRAVTACGVGTVLLYLPFRLFGQMSTFELQWVVSEGSLVGRIAGGLDASGWTTRLVQGALAGVVGAGVAMRRHGSVLVVVICAISVRLLLDPLRLTYYWMPLVVLLLVWAWTTQVAVVRRWRVVATACAPVAPIVPYLLPQGLWWAAGDMVTVAIPVLCLLAESRRLRGSWSLDDRAAVPG